MAERSESAVMKILSDIVNKWMSAKDERTVGNATIIIPPKFISIRHENIASTKINASNGAIYDDTRDEKSANISVETRAGDDDNGTGYDFTAECAPIDRNITEIKDVANRIVGKSLNASIASYFDAHSIKSVQTKDIFKKMKEVPKVIDISVPEFPIFEYDSIARILEKYSRHFGKMKSIEECSVGYSFSKSEKHFVTSEGTVITSRDWLPYCAISLAIKDADGRKLEFSDYFYSKDPKKMFLERKLQLLGERLYKRALERMECPIQESGSFDVLMDHEQIGVLFHEDTVAHLFSAKYILEDNLTTFDLQKLNQKIMPDFISLYDDPMLPAGKNWSNFKYDDEGVQTERKLLVERGILRGYLTDRTSAYTLSKLLEKEIPAGNSRMEEGSFDSPEPRISNLDIITSTPKLFSELKSELIKRCIKQDKEYGLMLYGSHGGFVNVDMDDETPGVNATFPTFIYRLYADGRMIPVKCAHTVGSAYNLLNSVEMLGKSKGYAPGFCGASSGSVPTGEYAMHGLLSDVEFVSEKKDLERPPLLKDDDDDGDCEEDE
jgi:TldD protein